jgi:hypothetical protein
MAQLQTLALRLAREITIAVDRWAAAAQASACG